jgi:hypothetical protein
MRKVKSRQKKVKFSFCKAPVTIDKSASWGPGNFQNFPDGVFFKHDDKNSGVVTHGVQPNAEKTAPIGWEKNAKGTFDKLPIWVDKKVITEGTVTMQTKDGEINYEIKAPSCKVYNGADKPDLTDGWIMKVGELIKNYRIIFK